VYPLVVLKILHLLEGHPADVAGDDQTTVVYLHVYLVLVALDELLATQVARVFVPGLPLVDDSNVVLQALLVTVGEAAVTALIPLVLNVLGLVHLARGHVSKLLPTEGTFESFPCRVMEDGGVPDQTLLQLEHAGTVLALVRPVVLVYHQVSLHIAECVVPLLTGRALVTLTNPSVLLSVKASQEVLIRDVFAHDDEFFGILIQAVVGEVQHNVVIRNNSVLPTPVIFWLFFLDLLFLLRSIQIKFPLIIRVNFNLGLKLRF